MVVPAFEGHELATNDPTFEDILHRIRVNLAGRVAEDLYLGAGQTSAIGSAEDLQRATDLAISLIKDWGYGGATQKANLAVFSGDTSQNELSRIEESAKNLLTDEYMKVSRILEDNQAYYNRIVSALSNKKILLPEDFEKLSADLKDLEELAA
jgi:ATP-dependent Zn protease